MLLKDIAYIQFKVQLNKDFEFQRSNIIYL